jgi:integrase
MKRRRGQGHIFRRPGTACWTIQYYASKDGRRIRVRESTATANYNQAQKLLTQRLAAEGRGEPVGPNVDRTTLDQLLAMVEADYRVNGRRSLDRAQQAAAHLRAYFGGERKARDVTHDRITAYAAQRLGDGAKPSTVNYEMAILRRAFRLGLRAGKIGTRPEFSMLHVDNARKGFFEPEQYRAVVQHLPDYLKPLAEVAYATGWRVKSELLTRQWRHIDLAGWLRLDPGETKNGEGREFPFTAELRAVLHAQRERVSELERASGRIIPWVFVHPDGTPISDFRLAWSKACRVAGVPGRLVHDFRRTAVRNLERAGVPRSAAMKLTGHKTEAVYRRYAITDAAMLQEAAAKLDAFLASEMVPVKSSAPGIANHGVSPSLALLSEVRGNNERHPI